MQAQTPRRVSFQQKVPSVKSSVDALDLAHPKKTKASSTTVEPRHDETKLKNLIIDFTDFEAVDQGAGKEGASSQAARYMKIGEKGYRLKRNENRPNVTFHEVFAARLLNTMGFANAPSTSFVSDAAGKPDRNANDVWIASPQVSGFKDLGSFLAESGKKYVSEDQKDAYQKHLDAYHRSHIDAKNLLEGEGPIAKQMSGYKKGGVEKLDDAQHAELQPLRDHYRAALQAQEQMLDLLPPSFHDELLRSFYTSEIVGNWDFLNHDRANTGFAIDKGTAKAHTVDFGNSGPIGFGGKTKPESLTAANQPARIDDPYLQKITNRNQLTWYIQGKLHKPDVEMTAVSRTFGAVGQLPRSSVSAHLLAPVIVQERERGPEDKGGLHAAPSQALEVAWQLKNLPPDIIGQFANTFFEQGRNHKDPAIKELFSLKITGYADGNALAREYQSRVNQIVSRAEQGGQLLRWVERNPERAAEISRQASKQSSGDEQLAVTDTR